MHRINVGHKQYSSALPPGIRYSNDQTHYSIGRSIYFQGTQDSYVVATNASFATYPVTVEAWVYSIGTSGALFELQNPTTGQFTGYINQGVSQTDRANLTSVAQNWVNFSANAWHHVAFTLWSSTASTTTADRIVWWLDGISNGATAGGSITMPSTPTDYTATGETRLILGKGQYSLIASNNPFTGFISELRVSNTARYGTAAVNISPPNGAMSSDANTLLLLKAP
jgi:hypothetical protein